MTDTNRAAAPSPPRPLPWRPRGKALRHTARLLGWVATLLLALVLAGAGALFWRLAQGPVAVDALAPYIEQALEGDDGRIDVAIGSLVLSWAGEGESGASVLDLRARQVRIAGAGGAPIASVPELGIGLSLRELLLGRLAPTRLDLIRPQLTVVRHEDGHYGFDVRDSGSEAEPEAGTEVTTDLLDTLRRPPSRGRTMGLLRGLTVIGADLRVENRQLGLSWHASRADITLRRGEDGIDGRARLALDLGGQPATVEAAGAYRAGDGTTTVAVRMDGIDLAALAQVAPVLEPLRAAAVPVNGTLTATLDADFRPARLRFDVAAGAGSLRLPVRDAPYAVRSARARGEVDLSARRLSVEDLVLSLAEVQIGGSGTVMDEPDGPIGDGLLTVASAGRTAELRVAATPGNGGPRVTADLRDLVPAALATLAPPLAPLATAALPVSGSVTVDFDRSLVPAHGRIDVTAGPGRIDLPGVFEAPLDVTSLALRLSGDRDAGRLAVDSLLLDLGGPTIRATARVDATASDVAVAGEVTALGVPFNDLHRWWPLVASPNAREWVTDNLSKGVVREAKARFGGTAPRDNLAEFTPTLIDVTMDGGGMDVSYFRPLPPVTEVTAVHAATDGKTFTVSTQGGRIGDVTVGDGTIVITDLGGRESIFIDVPMQGPLRTVLNVLNSPPLEYPKRLDLDPQRTSGTVDARLHMQFPLLVDLKVDQLEITVTGKGTGVGIEKVAAGLDATAGNVEVSLDTKGMMVKGTARLDGVPANVDWRESFVSNARGPRTRVQVKATPSAADFARFIPDPAGYASGPVGTDIVFTVDRSKRMALTGTLDLARTTLEIPELGWSKPSGAAAAGRFALEFQKEKVAKVTGITVDGGGLKAAATIELTPATSALSRIVVSDLTVGRTRARGEVVPRDGGYAVTVSGDSLDLEALLKRSRATPDADDGRRTPLAISAKLGRAVFGQGRQLTQVTAEMRNDGRAWSRLDVQARAGDKGSLTVKYGPQGAGTAAGRRHELSIAGQDAGTVLRMLDVTDRIQGGTLKITGATVEPRADAPIAGQVELSEYTAVDVPTLARILNAISPSGFAELLGGGKGIHFGQLSGNFRKDGRRLALSDLRTSGSALGLTLEGEIDLGTDVANLHGTIVPVYGINRIIGQIPLLGDVLSGGAGQGIFAATWTVDGPLADPDVSVNPLAVLAPGFLRNLFFLGRGKGDTAPSGATPGTGRPPGATGDR